MERRIETVIQKLMAVAAALLVCFLVLVIGYGFSHPDSYGELKGTWSTFRMVVTLASGILFYLLLLHLLTGLLERAGGKKRRLALILAVAAAVCLQLFLTIRYPVQIWWDNTSVLSSAISIVDHRPEYFDQIYFNQLGHQNCFLFLTVILTYIARIVGIADAYLTLYFSLLDVVMLDAAMAVFLLLIKRLRSGKDAARVLLLVLTCPGMYLWCAYYYTTNVSILFMSLYFYLLHAMWEKKRSVPFYIGFGMLTVFGCQFRATMLLCVVATVIFLVFRRPKALLRAGAFLVLGGILMLGLLRFSYERMIPEYDADARFPVYHWLMMSAQGNGEYNDADLAFTSSFATKEEKTQATRQEYLRRLKEMGPAGVAALFVRKTVHNWSYGNHSYYPLFHRYDGLTDVLWTPRHQVMFFAEQVWHLTQLLLVLLGAALQVVHRWNAGREEQGAGAASVVSVSSQVGNPESIGKTEAQEAGAPDGPQKPGTSPADWEWLFMVALLGGFCFYLLWETFPYYSVGFLGLMAALCPEGMELSKRGFHAAGKKLPKAAAFALILLLAALPIGGVAATNWPKTVTPVVTQKKFNQMYDMGTCEVLTQTFEADRDFDTIRIWISKRDLSNASGGSYEISITGERSGEVFRKDYSTEGLERVDEVIETFPLAAAEGSEQFTLTIRRLSGGKDNPLSVGAYLNPDDPYLFGEMAADGKTLKEEMFFTVTCGGPDDVIRLYGEGN
ncbi:MAG: glycosyltransferase family 39 protein [Lachnospiraceae bacterium]|nr:glycosyltransferase family 39 protein [Lachnospiraceae bacterium]